MSPLTDRSVEPLPPPDQGAAGGQACASSSSPLPPLGGAGGGQVATGQAGRGHTYARRDYLCLDCIVPEGCRPSSVLCLWRADRRRESDKGQLELLAAVDGLSAHGPAALAAVAFQLGVVPSALGPPIRRARQAGYLALHAAEGRRRTQGLSLTPLGRQVLAQLLDDRPELDLSRHQRDCYYLLAAVRDLGRLGEVTASLVGRALGSDERNIAVRLRRLAALDLVAYDFGHVVLTGAGQRLLDTLQAYAVNLRPGPRLLIRARGCYRIEILPRAHSSPDARSSANAHPSARSRAGPLPASTPGRP